MKETTVASIMSISLVLLEMHSSTEKKAILWPCHCFFDTDEVEDLYDELQAFDIISKKFSKILLETLNTIIYSFLENDDDDIACVLLGEEIPEGCSRVFSLTRNDPWDKFGYFTTKGNCSAFKSKIVYVEINPLLDSGDKMVLQPFIKCQNYQQIEETLQEMKEVEILSTEFSIALRN